MTITFRILERCDRCETHTMCAVVRADTEKMVAELEKVAKASGHKTPDGELVFDCATFYPKHRGRHSATT